MRLVVHHDLRRASRQDAQRRSGIGAGHERAPGGAKRNGSGMSSESVSVFAPLGPAATTVAFGPSSPSTCRQMPHDMLIVGPSAYTATRTIARSPATTMLPTAARSA